MANWENLYDELYSLLDFDNVYFQPPENVKLKYPCVVFELADFNQRFADNQLYNYKRRYNLTVISKDPDGETSALILERFPYSRYDRHFVADNLYHDVLEVFY